MLSSSEYQEIAFSACSIMIESEYSVGRSAAIVQACKDAGVVLCNDMFDELEEYIEAEEYEIEYNNYHPLSVCQRMGLNPETGRKF